MWRHPNPHTCRAVGCSKPAGGANRETDYHRHTPADCYIDAGTDVNARTDSNTGANSNLDAITATHSDPNTQANKDPNPDP